MDSPTPDSTPLEEQDPRFPSGPWFGYYRQWGTQSRQRFTLTFRDGRVEGRGKDPCSEFGVRGTYDTETGAVSITKTYLGYEVHYNGAAADGDGITGRWEIRYDQIPADRGEFHIWPDELAMAEGRELRAEEPVQV
jgi:hypothetical protein